MPRSEYDPAWKPADDERRIDQPIRMPGDQNSPTGLRHVLNPSDLDAAKEQPH